MSTFLVLWFCVPAHAQDVASYFSMPVGYPTGTDWALNGGWGYMENEVSSGYEYHPGEDLNYIRGTDCGMEIRAAANGIVTESGDFGSGWGNIIEIKSTLGNGSNVWMIYAHGKTSYVSVGDVVTKGELIGLVGGGTLLVDHENDEQDVYEYSCHLHLEVRTTDLAADTWPVGHDSTWVEDRYENPRDFISRNGVPTSASSAIQAKADELWAIRPSGSGISCEEYASSGLICHETENMHWWAGLSDSYVIETWTDGTKGEVDLTFDPDNTEQDRAYVVWGGFREMFHLDGHADEYGPPIGDELDTTFDEYTGYDPYCDQNIGNNDGQIDSGERNRCIELFCGRGYSSMQRFRDATLCWNPSTWEAECDPKGSKEHCHEASGLASTPTVLEDDLLIYGSTIYWVHNGSTHGIVSAEMFEACGFSWSDPYPVTEDTFNLLPQGSLLDDPTDCGAVTDGTLVTQNGTVYEYWSEDASWHGYPSDLVFDACLNDWSSIQEMSSSVFNTITIGSVVDSSFECGMTYPGLLLSWNGTVYRITETGLKRGFTSSDVFSACGYDWSDVWALALDDYPVVTTLQDGSAISSTSDCANITGDLVHWEWTGTIYYLTGTGYKRGITSTEAMTSCGFDWNQVRYVTNANGAVVWTLGDAANITGYGDCP